jgi:glycosidase
MPANIEPSAPNELVHADLVPRGTVHPSPLSWRDQVLYFLLPDRFSDGNEDHRSAFDPSTPEQFQAADRHAWMDAGTRFQGGTLNGIRSKLDYLRTLGVTTLWIGPVWRQHPSLETYHGYGIQHFLDIDPRFGTRQDLRDLVDEAHDRGIYVLLDIIYNHSGNNWFYRSNGTSADEMPYRFEPPYPFHGWRSASGTSVEDVTSSEDAVWPVEFQDLDWYTRAGRIDRWDPDWWEDPLHPDTEFRRGDFYSLKNLNLQRNRTLSAVIKVYQYWIAVSNCDGFRIDTVKHVPWEASRNFCGAIREYAESIGKENFLLLGEVTGGADMARNYLEIFGRNIDVVLDIGEPSRRLAEFAKGSSSAEEYFSQFLGHDILGSHRETGRYHVSILDDHDMVGKKKQRFSAGNTIPDRDSQVAHAVGIQLTTLGIPCIYYGTEQAFDGSEDHHPSAMERTHEDRYIRESMFGGTFGAFETEGCHFFNLEHPSYRRVAAIARIRRQDNQVGRALRRGRQYLRETSFLDRPFSLPGAGELTAWSRILYDQEVLIAYNTHGTEPRGADVTVESSFHPDGSVMRVLYRSDWSDSQLENPPLDQHVPVVHRDGRATVRVDLPPAGMMILG